MKSAWVRLLGFVPTRKAALLLFLLGLAVFAFEALGWPMAKGRDTWDYLAYYLQLPDRHPPFSELQLFRTPITPIVVGLPLQLGGTWLLEVVFAVLYASAIVGDDRGRVKHCKDNLEQPGVERRESSTTMAMALGESWSSEGSGGDAWRGGYAR